MLITHGGNGHGRSATGFDFATEAVGGGERSRNFTVSNLSSFIGMG